MLSKSQIDRLGERLRVEELQPEDRIALDEYRKLFARVNEAIVREIGALFPDLLLTSRPGKSTPSIIAKLRRETIRLSQIQDIAGSRLLCDGLDEQDYVAEALLTSLGGRLLDRRTAPQYGYRAIHLVTSRDDLPYEIQIRTELQHEWAELSEKLADRFGHEIKYGEGNTSLLAELARYSETIRSFEEVERDISKRHESELLQRVNELKPQLKSVVRALANQYEGEQT